MKALARALINAAAYLDLSGDEGLDAEESVLALEEIAYNLSYCTEKEKDAVCEALADMRSAEIENGPRPEMLEFLNTFLVSFGIEGEDEMNDADEPPRLNLL